MDTFRLEAINLGELVKLRIGHDNRGVGPGWFLEKVTVEDESSGKVFEFPCHRWLAKDEDDRQITRELICVNGSQQADMYMTPGEVNIKARLHERFFLRFRAQFLLAIFTTNNITITGLLDSLADC